MKSVFFGFLFFSLVSSTATASEACKLGSFRANPEEQVLVRTYNGKRGSSGYPKRIKGVAQVFSKDFRTQAGFVGMQEVKEDMKRCPWGFRHGAKCFGSFLQQQLTLSVGSVAWKNLGVTVDTRKWVIEGKEKTELGKDSIRHWPKRSTRRLLGVNAKHRTKGWPFTFYSTHLSHGDQESQRLEQVRKLFQYVRGHFKAGELTPIVVGDFNCGPGEDAFKEMSRHFELINKAAVGCLPNGNPQGVGIDHVWVGKHSSFREASGTFVPVQYQTAANGGGMDLKSPYSVDDYYGPLSDHNAPTFLLEVRKFESPPPPPPPECRAGQRKCTRGLFFICTNGKWRREGRCDSGGIIFN